LAASSTNTNTPPEQHGRNFRHAQGRPGLPEEIAAAIAYLAGDSASFVHGAVLPVDGGRIAV
jgi:NAD(P)-dependent dehydrogenase (short-subunit alcohol dehydrogenase family)